MTQKTYGICEDCEVELKKRSIHDLCGECESKHIFCTNCEEDMTADYDFHGYTNQWDDPICMDCYEELEDSRCADCEEYPDDCYCCPECGDQNSENELCDFCEGNTLTDKEW